MKRNGLERGNAEAVKTGANVGKPRYIARALRVNHQPIAAPLARPRAHRGVLGVDPGIRGGLAIVAVEDGAAPRLVEAIDIPVIGTGAKERVDAIAIRTWIGKHDVQHAFIERAQAMPKQGSSSGFKYGRAVGAIEAAIALLRDSGDHRRAVGLEAVPPAARQGQGRRPAARPAAISGRSCGFSRARKTMAGPRHR